MLSDIETVRRVDPSIGLVLNEDKCEIVTDDVSVVASMKAVMHNIRHIPSGEAVLLSAPIGEETAVDTVLSSKLAVFRLLASRLASLNVLYFLKKCVSIPKLLYSMRCAACYNTMLHVL